MDDKTKKVTLNDEPVSLTPVSYTHLDVYKRQHLERPEVKEALEGGTGDAHRESLTLSVDTYYYARLLNDGNILRVSLETESIFSMYTNVLWGLLGVGCCLLYTSRCV